jgi:hypothetical protein
MRCYNANYIIFLPLSETHFYQYVPFCDGDGPGRSAVRFDVCLEDASGNGRKWVSCLFCHVFKLILSLLCDPKKWRFCVENTLIIVHAFCLFVYFLDIRCLFNSRSVNLILFYLYSELVTVAALCTPESALTPGCPSNSTHCPFQPETTRTPMTI